MNQRIFHHPNWALTALGNPIELYGARKPGDAESSRWSLWIGGVHGDEPEGVRMAQDLLKHLQKSNTWNRNWLLIPCLNPDGFAKNSRTNSQGVDLNRNFPSRDWSPQSKAPRYNPGPRAASELEVQAVLSLIETYSLELIVHFHSWEASIVYTGESLASTAKKWATQARVPAQPDIGYPTPGSLGQYAWLEKSIPVICVEAQEGSPLENLWPQFGPALIEFFSAN